MKRTTIMAEEGLLYEARHLARREGKTLSALVRAALLEYITAHRPLRKLPDFVGMGHSGDPLWAGRDEEILAAEIDPIEGWSPGRRRTEAANDQTGANGGAQANAGAGRHQWNACPDRRGQQ